MINRIKLWKWILLFVLSFVLGFIGLLGIQTLNSLVDSPLLTFFGAIVFITLYAGAVRLIEKEPAKDIPLKSAAPHIGLGILIGALYMGCVVAIISAMGCAHIEKCSFDLGNQLVALLLFFSVAVEEEILFRGILFRWIDNRWGLAPALIVSAIFFGAVHIIQPNASLWSCLAITIEAGVLLGAAYKWSGTLWLPIGIHWAWNYVQGDVFGIAVSGISDEPSFFKTVMHGPDIITGAEFGAEASVIAIILGGLLALWLLLSYNKKRKKMTITIN